MDPLISADLAHLGFERIQPSPMLRPYVQCFWRVRSGGSVDNKRVEFMHPEGGSGLLFNFGAPISFDGEVKGEGCLVQGPNSQVTQFRLLGAGDLFGIRFHPGAGYPFLQVPLSKLRGQRLSVEELELALNWQQLWDFSTDDLAGRIACVESWLLARLAQCREARNPLLPVLSVIDEEAFMRIERLSGMLAVSERQLERQFGLWVGMPPKQYARLRRVRSVRQRIKQSAELSLTDTAYELGYYDQAHFIREFKQVVGITPGQYRRRVFSSI